MIEISILLRKNTFNDAYKKLGEVEVNSKDDEEELIGFLKAGIEAYEDWKVNGE